MAYGFNGDKSKKPFPKFKNEQYYTSGSAVKNIDYVYKQTDRSDRTKNALVVLIIYQNSSIGEILYPELSSNTNFPNFLDVRGIVSEPTLTSRREIHVIFKMTGSSDENNIKFVRAYLDETTYSSGVETHSIREVEPGQGSSLFVYLKYYPICWF